MKAGIVKTEHCYLRKEPGSTTKYNESGIEDEIFSGWAVRTIGEPESNGWIKTETHYGYQGYVSMEEIDWISTEELKERQNKSRFFRISAAEADLLSMPKVQGLPLELILKHAVVELLEWEVCDGWSRIRTAAGREGYVRTVYLNERLDDDGYLLRDRPDGKSESYFHSLCRNRMTMKNKLRKKLADNAVRYLGVQYRWGGKSSQGIDCSGLMFMSYLECGILIFRDSRIHPDFPVHEIEREQMGMGDLIYFPGHVAMYLGEGKYIHSTGFADRPGVGINSLNPEDVNYREDLANKILAFGSVF